MTHRQGSSFSCLWYNRCHSDDCSLLKYSTEPSVLISFLGMKGWWRQHAGDHLKSWKKNGRWRTGILPTWRKKKEEKISQLIASLVRKREKKRTDWQVIGQINYDMWSSCWNLTHGGVSALSCEVPAVPDNTVSQHKARFLVVLYLSALERRNCGKHTFYWEASPTRTARTKDFLSCLLAFYIECLNVRTRTCPAVLNRITHTLSLYTVIHKNSIAIKYNLYICVLTSVYLQ